MVSALIGLHPSRKDKCEHSFAAGILFLKSSSNSELHSRDIGKLEVRKRPGYWAFDCFSA